MSGNEHAALVRAIFCEVSEQPLDAVGPETRITDLGIDSITFGEIVVRIEEALDIEVPFARWLRVRTVQDALDTIDRATECDAREGTRGGPQV